PKRPGRSPHGTALATAALCGWPTRASSTPSTCWGTTSCCACPAITRSTWRKPGPRRSPSPAARAAGVRTPALIAYADACDLLPVPYLVVERVRGRALSELDLEPGETPDVWREVGRDLARLHIDAEPSGQVGELWVRPDPRELVEQRAADGWFTALEARWLGAWLERLAAPPRPPPPAERLLHPPPPATHLILP